MGASHRIRVAGCGLLAAAAITGLPVLAGPAAALAAAGTAPHPAAVAWLDGVSATSGRNVWAAGAFGLSPAFGDGALIEHWNGRSWKAALRLLPPGDNDVFYFAGVAATSGTSAFAAGTFESQYAVPLIDHWDGARWIRDNAPAEGNGDCQCAAVVTAVAATWRGNAWAAGYYYPGAGPGTLTMILHKTRRSWALVPSPSPGTSSELQGVAALSRSDAWAAGVASSGPSGQRNTVIEHWDGTTWTLVPSPDPSRAGCVNDELLGVAASPAATWAVGDYCGAALTLRLEDGQWRQVPAPSPPTGVSEQLASVTVTTKANAWAAGRIGRRALILHWNGKKWATARVPNPAGATSSRLASITAVSPSIAWAVGQADYPHHVIKLLIERWDGKKWKLVPVPNPTP